MKRVGWWGTRKEAASMQKPVWDIHSCLPFRPMVLKMEPNLLDFFQPFDQAVTSTMGIPRG